MDSQRPFLYLALLFMLFLIWTAWQQDHSPKPVEPTAVSAPSAGQQASEDVPAQENAPVPSASAQPSAAAADSENKGRIITVRTDTLLLQISTQGGTVVQADLPTYPVSLDEPDKPVKILDISTRDYVAQSGLQLQGGTGGESPDHLTLYNAAQTEYTLGAGQNELVVPLTWQGTDGVTVTKRFVFKRGSFLVGVEHEVTNHSANVWSGTAYAQLKHGQPPKQSGGMFGGVHAYIGGAYYHEDKFAKLSFSDISKMSKENTPLKETAENGWVAMLEHYFISAWVPAKGQKEQYYSMVSENQNTEAYILGIRSPVQQIAPGATGTFRDSLYVGPKDQDTLAKIADGLDLTVDYGIFAFISKPIFWLMQFIHKAVGNWGWTIIILTVLIKGLFFWPSAISYKSMAKMKAVSPKLKEINERYANDPQAKQKAMMEIYRKEKINPLGGCLPILLQIPVFMGLYWVLLESVELRQAPWILWYKDLSIMDPYFVLPLIYGASMFLQQKLNPPQVDPMQQKIFQFMPIMFTFMFLWFPSGLVLYWVVNSILSMAQQWYINNKIVGHA